MCFFLSFKKNSNCRRVTQKLWPLWIMLRFVSNQVVILLLFLRLIKVFYFPVYWLSELIENATNSSIAEFFKTHSTCKNCVQKQLNSWFIFILLPENPTSVTFLVCCILYFLSDLGWSSSKYAYEDRVVYMFRRTTPASTICLHV